MSAPTVRRASLDEVYALRWEVLFKGTGRPTAEYADDRGPATLHVGAFDGDRCVCCATFLPSEWEGHPAWQLRGMATAADWRNRGIGGKVLAFGEEELRRTTGVHNFWCNARLPAVPFYQRHGWQITGDRFDIDGVGPHHRMVKGA